MSMFIMTGIENGQRW